MPGHRAVAMISAVRVSLMPARHPPEFRRRAIELARAPGASVARVVRDLGISESGDYEWRDPPARHQPPAEASAPAGGGGPRRSRATTVHRRCSGSPVVHRCHRNPTRAGKVAAQYSTCAAGACWSIAEHTRSDLGVDTPQTAIWRRRPRARSCTQSAAASRPHGCSATGCATPDRSDPMGRAASSVENSIIRSCWSTPQRELLDQTSFPNPRTARLGVLRVDRDLLQTAPQAHIAKKRAEGKTQAEAMRCLKPRLSDVVY